MTYSPENNPYIPGDPYSYDLAWMVDKINAWTDPLDSAERAEAAEAAAKASEGQAEAWAKGTIDGDPVTADDPQYQNNSKYYADQAADDAADAHADMLTAKDYADNIADPVSGLVTSWLTDHISNPSNPPLDTSLSVAGSAADSKAAGDAISAVRSAADDRIIDVDKIYEKLIESRNLFNYYSAENVSGYINSSGNIVAGSYKTSGFVKVKPNTKYYVLGYGSGYTNFRFLILCN